MKKNKGFTLIELLAVLVIMAVIALISVPIITNLIRNARISSSENAVAGLYKAVDVYYGRQIVNNEGIWFENKTMLICFGTSCTDTEMINGNSKIENSGTKPTAGIISVDRNGKIAVVEELVVNDFHCTSTSSDRDSIKCS